MFEDFSYSLVRRILGSSHQASVDDIMFMVERDSPLSAKSGRKEE
jgi:hypothetical protein